MRPSEDEETNFWRALRDFGAQRTPRRPTKPNSDSHGFDNHGLMCALSSFCEIRANYWPFLQKTAEPLICLLASDRQGVKATVIPRRATAR